MLILSRKVGERIYIGDDSIQVVVVGVKNGEVRIGVEAPKSVGIWRQEVHERMALERAKETRKAAAP